MAVEDKKAYSRSPREIMGGGKNPGSGYVLTAVDPVQGFTSTPDNVILLQNCRSLSDRHKSE